MPRETEKLENFQRDLEQAREELENMYMNQYERDNKKNESEEEYIEKKPRQKKPLTDAQLKNLENMRKKKAIKAEAKKIVNQNPPSQGKLYPVVERPELSYPMYSPPQYRNPKPTEPHQVIKYAPKNNDLDPELIEKINLLGDYVAYKIEKKQIKKKKQLEEIEQQERERQRESCGGQNALHGFAGSYGATPQRLYSHEADYNLLFR